MFQQYSTRVNNLGVRLDRHGELEKNETFMHELLICAWVHIELFTGVTQGHIVCRGESLLVPGKGDADLSINQPGGKWSSLYCCYHWHSYRKCSMPLHSNLFPLTVNIVLLMPAGHLKRIGLIQVKFEPQTSLFKAIGCSSWKKERKCPNVTTRSTFAVYSMELFMWPSCMIETELQHSHDAPCHVAG